MGPGRRGARQKRRVALVGVATPTLPRALNFRHELRGGMSRPCVFQCSDGQERVLKFESRATKAALASDWIGALLATELGIRTPAPSLVELDEDAILTMGTAAGGDALPGYGFGTAYLPFAQNIFGIRNITSCVNHPDALGRLAVLDTWIGTEDRLRPDGAWNLLKETDQGAKPQLVAIDFGMAFAGALVPLIGTGGHFPIQLVCPMEVRPLVDPRAVTNALAHAEALTEAETVRLVGTTPEEWLSASERGSVIRFLFERRESLRSSLAQLDMGA